MNEDVTLAVLRLQNSLMTGRLQPWRAEQIEEALNSLLANPHRTGEPFHLERNAMSDARKKLQRRTTLFADHVAAVETTAMNATPAADASAREGYDVLRSDVIDTIRRHSSDADRAILAIALDDGTAGDVAEAFDIDYDVAKVRLCRARRRARAFWQVLE